METLTARGRLVRVVVTLVGAGLLLAGTLVGSDDNFPFGPFRMYATTDRLDAPVAEALVLARDAAGDEFVLTERETGIRRAEIEGQLSRFAADPTRLNLVVDAYHRRNPDRPALDTVSIVIRRHAMTGGRPTGVDTDETVVNWQVTR
ncbi:hypothetical protein [Micromonospora sp. NBC_01796]|uniref:hypothetical protein n=1 Tax=Micromonospora sp. NBC_01796 TaxID=2975987 RepID=UPI002DDC5F4D|nr:hypothetical protein [Micromonospora sp. NBC_01796]WSA82705.1 hypothetical protein OIE47_19800 [Micromonospora sp. NBC_01796]